MSKFPKSFRPSTVDCQREAQPRIRLACLYVPDFELAALLRAQPELRDESVAIANGQGPRAKILAVSAAAARCGAASGLTVAQATTLDARLIVRQTATDTLRAAQAALCDAAESFSPRVEDAGDGVVYLDLEGLGTLFDSESQLANALAQRAGHLGMEAQERPFARRWAGDRPAYLLPNSRSSCAADTCNRIGLP